MTDSELSFVGQINTEYREACKAESNALQHAIKCGEYLTLAKENVKAEKGSGYLGFSPTARRYHRQLRACT